MDNDVSTMAQRAIDANTKVSWATKIKNWFSEADLIESAFMVVGVAALVLGTLFEANNSAMGWTMIAKGAAPSGLSFLFGGAMTLGYIMFHRRSSERFRAGKKESAWRHVAVAVGFTLAALFGVFSNTASKTALSANTATETNTTRALLVNELRQLQAQVSPDQLLQYKALRDVTERTIQSKEGEAMAWGMKDGATPLECAENLRQRQRDICNSLNGNDDQMGLRNELVMHKASIETFHIKMKRIEEAKAGLEKAKFTEGNAHWESMSKLTTGSVSDEAVRIWGTFAFSVLILFIVGFGWDAVLEKFEDEE